jgi:tRNA pseudouridine38-40 synthase
MISCAIEKSEYYKGSFFPDKVYTLKFVSDGFMRHQVRLMAGELIQVGLGESSGDKIQQRLKGNAQDEKVLLAPASGLKLYSIKLL